jgi:NAD(P)-dependent dehydrogenase (short-subunit alcohol dehydrogenase family)
MTANVNLVLNRKSAHDSWQEVTGHEEENTLTKEAHHDKVCPSPVRSREPRISIASLASGDSCTKKDVHADDKRQGGCVPKTWIITGSSRGLGRALAEAALAAGEKVAATARRVDDLQDLKDQYRDQVLLLRLDVTNETQAIEAVTSTIRTFGQLDVLVNNAGYGNVAPVEDTTLEEFRAEIETNLFGTIILSKAVLRYFRERGAGPIIQVTSIAGRIGPIGRAPYAAAKWGVEGFSETLAKEVAPLGVKVTIIEPGGFRTDFAGSSTTLREGRPEYASTVGETVHFQRHYNGKQPGDPTRAAAVVLELASMDHPPLRILLGSDAYEAVEKNDLAKIELGRQWKELSHSTDFPKPTDT